MAAPIVGSQDDGGPYGAGFDALNVFDLLVIWNTQPTASLTLVAQLPVVGFDSIFPCGSTGRDCLRQPGVNSRTGFSTSWWRRGQLDLIAKGVVLENGAVGLIEGRGGIRYIRRDDVVLRNCRLPVTLVVRIGELAHIGVVGKARARLDDIAEHVVLVGDHRTP